MKKELIITVLITFSFLLTLSSQETIYIYPEDSVEKWTGSVRYSPAFQWVKYDIRAGKTDTGFELRGWSMFDIDVIPNDAIITNIELIIVTKSTGGDNIILEITDIQNNPLELEDNEWETLFIDIGSGDTFATNLDALQNDPNVINYINLNEIATSNLQQKLTSNSWWAIGFKAIDPN